MTRMSRITQSEEDCVKKVSEVHQAPSQDEPTRPSAARIWDYYLGGACNFAVDRHIANQIIKIYPEAKSSVLENRAFLRRSVRHSARSGVTQFIDIGCGLPLVRSTHETALAVAPQAKILYVDNDDSVVEVGRNAIHQMGYASQVGMIKASALEPQSIVEHAESKRLIDFQKPVAILMLALIHFFPSEQYRPLLDFWKSILPRGSELVISHVTRDGGDQERLRQAGEVFSRTPMPAVFRSREELEIILSGWEVEKPGIVRPEDWGIEELEAEQEVQPRTKIWWVAVGKLH